MSDLNSALSNVYNHLNNFNNYNVHDAIAELHKDNAMLEGMQTHSVDLKSLELAANISVQIKNLQNLVARPPVGAQQIVATKIHGELKNIKRSIEKILEIPPKHETKIEKNHQTKA